MHTIKFARLPTGNAQIKKKKRINTFVFFFYSLNLLLYLERQLAAQVSHTEEAGTPWMSQPQASFPRHHLHKLKLPKASASQNFFFI